MGRDYRRLAVYRKAYGFVLDCYPTRESSIPLDDTQMYQQLRRALLSIPLNIAEGCGSHSEKVLLNHLSYAYGSAREVEVLIMLCRDLAYWDSDVAEQLLSSLDEVKRMLYGLLRSVELGISQGRRVWKYT